LREKLRYRPTTEETTATAIATIGPHPASPAARITDGEGGLDVG